MTTYTDTIGSVSAGHGGDGDFATLALWHGTSATVPVSGDVMVVQFLSGTHDIGGAYNNFNEVDFDIVFQAHPSALHNGNWDEGAILILSSHLYMNGFGDQTVGIEFRDIHWRAGNNTLGLIGITNNTSGNCAEHDFTLTFNRCLIDHTSGVTTREFMYFYAGGEDVDPSGNVSAVHNATLTFNDCVVNNSYNYGFYPFPNQSQAANITLNVNGCTVLHTVPQRYGFFRPNDFGPKWQDSYWNVNISGSIFDGPFQHAYSVRDQATSATKSYNFTDFITTRSALFHYFDYLGNLSQSGTVVETNVTTDAILNYDNTVTSGEVCFVGPSGPEGNYRLISDNDNLAVKYVTNASPLSRDVTDGPRSGLTDAGAFQSISDRVLSATIGYSTSADAATFNIWNAIGTDGQALNDQDRWNRLVLHGDTIRMIYEPGTYSSTADSVGVSRHSPDSTRYYDWVPVAVNWEIKGQKSHNGNWDEGAIFHYEGINAVPFSRGDTTNRRDSVNGENWLFEDLVVINSDAAYIGLFDWGITTDRAIDDSLTINRCLLRGRRNANSASPIRLNCIRGASDGSTGNFDKDSLGRKERIGSFTFNLTNSVVETRGRLIEMNSGRYNGDHIYNYEGSYIRAGRLGADRMGYITYYAPTQGWYADDGGNLGMNVKGCIIDNVQGPDDNASMATIFGDYTTSNATYHYINWSSTCVDNIFATPSNLNRSFSSTTNTLFDVSTTYDGTVTSGQVGFVDSGGVSAFKDYRLVADENNLAVRYMDLSNALSKDITGYARPGSTDPGAFQSVSNRIVSATVGPDGSNQYGTAQIWYGELDGSSIVNGDTLLLRTDAGLSGADYTSINYTGAQGTDREVNYTIHLKSKEPVAGDWESGTVIRSSDNYNTLSLGTFRAYRNTLDVIYEDFVLSADSNHYQPSIPIVALYHYAGDFTENWWNNTYRNESRKTESTYDNSVKFKNCMISTYDLRQPLIRYLYDSRIVDSEGNTTWATGTNEYENCVVVGNYGGNYAGLCIAGTLYNPIPAYDYKIIGSTLVDCFAGSHYTSPGGINHYVNGSLIITGLSGLTENGLYAPYYFNGGWHYSTRTSTIHVTDSIFSQASANVVGTENGQSAASGILKNSIASGFVTNAQFDVPFNFDGTVSPSTVSFVSSATKDYRLVASEDNFASGYVSSFNLSGLDLAGNSRGDSPYDAGAFAITLQQVEDFLKSLGGPLVLQVGYRISNNRQRLNIGGGGEE